MPPVKRKRLGHSFPPTYGRDRNVRLTKLKTKMQT